MSKVGIHLKIEESTKQALQTLADDWGMSLSTLANLQFKQLARRQRLVLETDFPIMEMDEATEKELDKVYKEIKAGQVSRDFTDIDSFMADLESDSSP